MRTMEVLIQRIKDLASEHPVDADTYVIGISIQELESLALQIQHQERAILALRKDNVKQKSLADAIYANAALEAESKKFNVIERV